MHNNLGPVFKSSAHPESNLLYLRIICVSAYFIYSYVGIGGFMAIINLSPVVA
jgi:hypothetical protein